LDMEKWMPWAQCCWLRTSLNSILSNLGFCKSNGRPHKLRKTTSPRGVFQMQTLPAELLPLIVELAPLFSKADAPKEHGEPRSICQNQLFKLVFRVSY
jgi:hypothetical protein